ncbi:response regulator receiver domain [Flavobacterium sp. DSP2-3-1]|uniref:response regulator receiver domain n=1 Tax=Flavobacterium sp. DSP2-3-1 TaxID=2804620 RepID=UPI003CF8DD77
MNTYQTKASEVIRESIKSVIFIDEKAWNPFDCIPFDDSNEDHIRVYNLYNNFKTGGISFDVHTYKNGDENLIENDLEKYLFHKRDLVLLDWDLDNSDVFNVKPLKFLYEIIKQKQIHFCSIYTATPIFETILPKIYSFFSGITEDICEDILNKINEYADELIPILKKANIYDSTENNKLIGEINNINKDILVNVKEIVKKNFPESITFLKFAFDNTLPKPKIPLFFKIEMLTTDDNTVLIIDNTLISILKKDENEPQMLIDNFVKKITEDKNKSFYKLLGLEMQNLFSKKGAFLDPSILNISLDAFLHHKRQMHDDNFNDLIKNVLLKNAEQNISKNNLNLLESDFLKEIDDNHEIKQHEIISMNMFYNGNYLDSERILNFGDIFKDEDNNFYLCITALCDCQFPFDKIKNKFYFVKHNKILTNEEAIDYGDSGFISYINSICLKWSTDDEFIKPIQIYVPNNKIEKNYILAYDWFDGHPLSISLEYVFTLKQNYAQRIANQAFTYPVRVGVDFVKK